MPVNIIKGGAGGGASIEVNGTLIATSPVNLENGANITITNPSGGNVQFAVTGLATIATTGKWSDLQSPTAALTLAMAGNATTFNQTSAVNWTWANTTASSLAVGVSSPLLVLGGRYFGAAGGVLAADSSDTWSIQNILANGTQLSTTTNITNIAESAGSVVTLTLVGSTFSAGMVVEVSGFGSGKGDWLNGYCVTLLSGNATACTFNDPTAHGTLASTATTGTPTLTRVDSLSTLAFIHSGSPGGGVSGTNGNANTISFPNGTAATSTLSQPSPVLNLSGNYWTGSASAAEGWTIQDIPGNGTNPTTNLTFQHYGSGGTASVTFRGSATGGPAVNLNFSDWSIVGNAPAITGSNGMGFSVSASGWYAAMYGQATVLPYNVILAGQTPMGNLTQTSVGCQYGVAMGTLQFSTAGIASAPTAGSAKFYGAGVNAQINQTSSATGDYCGFMVNVTETAFLGTNAHLLDCQLACGITNISETSGSVVTLTVTNNTATTGQKVMLEGLTTGTWLNGHMVTLSSGTNS